jgi:predicted NAD-dependent protein-ADP-ribosyltransferase YbiA (DUF1768 family)
MELIDITAFQDQYWFLSNYYPAPVVYHGITYPSNEVAFQAQIGKDRRSFPRNDTFSIVPLDDRP